MIHKLRIKRPLKYKMIAKSYSNIFNTITYLTDWGLRKRSGKDMPCLNSEEILNIS